MKTTVVLLILLACPSMGEIEFSGSSSFFYNTSSGSNPWSELPVEFWRWRVNPVFTVAGIPILADIFLSSEESLQRQNMNRVYISSSPSASSRSREGSILSWISSIGIGASNPYFSTFTLNSAYVSGANLALNPGKFYFAAAGGRNRRGIQPDSANCGEYERNLYAIKTGLGPPYGNHLHLGILYGKDISGSIEQDSTFRITPSENWVTSLDYGAVMFDGRFRVEGEIAGSMFTRDTKSPEIEVDDIPQWLQNFSGANISSALGWASELSSSLRFSEYLLSASVNRVGPGFESMGSPYLRSDEISFETRADRYFMDRRISTGVWYRWKTDNLLETKNSTLFVNSYGIRTGFNFSHLPSFYISYSPSFSETVDSSTASVKTSLISLSANYRTMIADLDLNTAAAFSVHDNSAGTGNNNYSSTSIVLRETLSFQFPLVLTGCISTRRTRTGNYPAWKYTGDLRATWYTSQSLALSLGGNYTVGDGDKKTGFLLTGGFPISDHFMANLSGEYINYYSETKEDYTNTTGGSGITLVW